MKDITLTNLNTTSLFLKPINSKVDLKKTDKVNGYLINTNGNEKETRKIVDTLKQSGQNPELILAVTGHDDNFNRRVLETMTINYLVSPESGQRKDTLKQRDSGLNHVLAKIAKQKNIAIVINFTEINKLKPKDKALKLGKIMQNIKICRRAKCKIKIATFAKDKDELRTEKQLKDFTSTLGMSSQQVRDCVEF